MTASERRIRITIGDVSVPAILNDSATAGRIWDALPIENTGSHWGDEIYFTIPVNAPEENSQEVVECGDLGYWPPGSAFCIFYGRTPASQGDEIRPASAVNVVGRVDGDATVFKKASLASPVRLTREE